MRTNCALLALALLGLSAHPCSGQPSYEFGAKAGVNYADIQAQLAGAGGRRAAPAGGLTFTVDPAGTFAFQAELLYMGKGDTDEVIVSGEGDTAEISLIIDYIELPLFAKLQAPLLGNSVASLFAGPALAVKVNEELDDPTTGRTVPNITRPFDVGASAGVEFGFGVGEGRLLLEARVTPGLFKISDGDYLRPEATNHVFTLMTGFSF